VSNLTNLLAFTVSGLSFAGFAALMALPWLASIGVEYAVIGWFFGGDLAVTTAGAAEADPAEGSSVGAGSAEAGSATGRAAVGNGGGGRVEHATVLDQGSGGSGDLAAGRPGARTDAPVFSLVVVAVTLGGFVVASAAGANPAWAALGGAALLAVRALARRETTPAAIARGADIPFLLFVLALGVVVVVTEVVVDNGLGSALRPVVVPGTSLPALLAVAGLAALLAAAVNNLPAVLVLLPLAAPSGAGAVLAVLIGVNIGPNLTYTGSLATLLWRRVLHGYDTDAPLGEFTRLGVATVLPGLALSVVALWLGLQV